MVALRSRIKSPLKAGFTLVEMSIVLVIIGLIIGGVLVGRDLIKSAQTRSLIRQEKQFETAVQTFRSKYGCLPGDCQNATSFWGQLSSCPGEANSYGTTATCNGNADGLISANWGDSIEYREQFRFWQHLGNAGLISGSFSGSISTPGGGNRPMVNVDMPESSFKNNYGWLPGYMDSDQITIYLPMGSANSLFLNPNQSIFNGGSGITPTDIYDIDRKIDDGYPLTGHVVTANYVTWYSPGCWNNVTPATYNTSSTIVTCPLVFTNAF